MSFLFSFFKKDDITENKPEVKPTVEETHETKKEKELRDVRSETIQKKSTEQLQQEYDVKKIIKIQAVYRGRDERKRIAQLSKSSIFYTTDTKQKNGFSIEKTLPMKFLTLNVLT